MATPDRFRILSVDGGGIRGLIPALVIRDLERRVADATGERRPLTDYFHLFAGTSTGGLIALGMTAPDPSQPGTPRMGGDKLVGLYTDQGPRIFAFTLQRILSLGGWIGPKHSAKALHEVVEEEIGSAPLADALRDVVVCAYDMTAREPHFFKRWRARESQERNPSMSDAAMATACAPTYFPSWEVGGQAMVDGGVFAANPTVAAVAEALKRRGDDPAELVPDELFTVSLGTGVHEVGYPQSKVRHWGNIGWIRPRPHDPALVRAILDGQSDAADHWAHMILNYRPGDVVPDRGDIGRGPRYFRFQVTLPDDIPLDGAGRSELDGLEKAGNALIAERDKELDEVARRLAAAGPIPAS